MKKFMIALLTGLFLVFWGTSAMATAVLYDWAFNVNGVLYESWIGDSMPTDGTLNDEDLGTLTYSTSVTGSHSFIGFFDYEVDQEYNTFFNENSGALSGTPASTINGDNGDQSWEVDEPGFVFGDIYEHVSGLDFDWNPVPVGLDDTNSIPVGSENDVSWAIGWDFILAENESALITLLLADDINNVDTSAFYLSQTDASSGETIYFASSLTITPGGEPIPEPATLLLLGSGFVGLIGYGRKKLQS